MNDKWSEAKVQLLPSVNFEVWLVSALGVELLNQFQACWPANLHLKYSTVSIETMNTILSLLSLTVLFQALD